MQRCHSDLSVYVDGGRCYGDAVSLHVWQVTLHPFNGFPLTYGRSL